MSPGERALFCACMGRMPDSDEDLRMALERVTDFVQAVKAKQPEALAVVDAFVQDFGLTEKGETAEITSEKPSSSEVKPS